MIFRTTFINNLTKSVLPLCLFFVLLFSSCQKEETTLSSTDTPVTSSFSMDQYYSITPDNVLTFHSQETFESFIAFMIANPVDYNQWRDASEASDFNSASKRVENLTEEDMQFISSYFSKNQVLPPSFSQILFFEPEVNGEYDAQIMIDLPVVQDVVNENGLFRIGEESVIYKRNSYFVGQNLSAQDELAIAALPEERVASKYPMLRVSPIERGEMITNTQKIIWDEDDLIYRPGGSRRRILVDIRDVSASSTRALSARTRHQIRVFPAWYPRRTNWLDMTVNAGTIQWGTAPVEDLTDQNPLLTRRINRSTMDVALSACTFCLEATGSVNITHEVNCEDGTIRNFNTNANFTF